MSIHHEATIAADPSRVYELLADANALSAMSGMAGVVGASAGDAFAAFDGHVTGRQIELEPGTRIVQAWRFPAWDRGTYSIVRFTLLAENGGTRLVIHQDGEPDDWHDHIAANWPTFYLTPLAQHFGTHASL